MNQVIYDQLAKPRDQCRILMRQLLRDEADVVFREWVAMQKRVNY